MDRPLMLSDIPAIAAEVSRAAEAGRQDGAFLATLTREERRRIFTEQRAAEKRAEKDAIFATKVNTADPARLFETWEAERFLGMTKDELKRLRDAGKAPAFVKIGRAVYYQLAALEEFARGAEAVMSALRVKLPFLRYEEGAKQGS